MATLRLKERAGTADDMGVTRRILLPAALALASLWGAGAAVAASQPPPSVTAPAPAVAPPVASLDGWASSWTVERDAACRAGHGGGSGCGRCTP